MFASIGWEHAGDILLILLFTTAIVLIPVGILALFRKRLTANTRIGLCVIVFVSIIVLGLFLPSVERVPRIYYQGHDQFYWGNRLNSKSSNERQQAATALATLLKSSKSNVRILVIQDLGECEPDERQIALDALLAFANDQSENEYLRGRAEYAIGRMFFRHVIGTEGSEVERYPYEKKIVQNGWDAVVREVDNGKKAGNAKAEDKPKTSK